MDKKRNPIDVETRVYLVDFFKLLKRRLEIAKRIKDEEFQTSMLISLINIEGMGKVWNKKFDRGLATSSGLFIGFMKEFCKIDSLDENKIKHIYSILRCSLAHDGIIDTALFIDDLEDGFIDYIDIGDFSEDFDGGAFKTDSKTFQTSVNFIIRVFENCMNNFEKFLKEKTENFEREYFMLESFKCGKCQYLFTNERVGCYFCKLKRI